MSRQSYLIDTNIIIGLEDSREVGESYARFSKLAAKFKLDVVVHEAAKEDIARDRDLDRRRISLSKLEKYNSIRSQRGIGEGELRSAFGNLPKPNDVVDARLLHALEAGAVDFLVTQDKGLHQRAQRRSPELGRRVLFINDAADLLTQTYEPQSVPIRRVADVVAHEINPSDPFFDTLKVDYPEFGEWWSKKCVAQRRSCWAVFSESDELAGLVVHKDERRGDTDASGPGDKILKICTFKVAPTVRGVKLGELLLKKALWHAQANKYDRTYLTTFDAQDALIELLEFYGFEHTYTKTNGELVYERSFARKAPPPSGGETAFEIAKKLYPLFVFDAETRGFGVPIKEGFHDTLYPDLFEGKQLNLFTEHTPGSLKSRPGNTIRKVYISRASSNLGDPGSLLFFYKLKSHEQPSQAITALGILESVGKAHSTRELMQMTGGRSVYSERELESWAASKKRPVKVINFLHSAYIVPPISLEELQQMSIVKKNPQQAIYEITGENLPKILSRSNLDFDALTSLVAP